MLLAIFFAVLGTLIIGLIVFGGGQVFIPLFQWLWLTLGQKFGWKWSQTDYDALIAISNLTPGVFSTKLAAITGFLIGNQHWYGVLLLFLTYSFFVIPAILMIYHANQVFKKVNTTKLLNYLNWLKPVIIGILMSLAAQLLLTLVLTKHQFNNPFVYWKNNDDSIKAKFFSGWRLYALLILIPVIVLWGLYGYYKKIHFLIIFMIAIIVTMVVLEPWLYDSSNHFNNQKHNFIRLT